MDEAEIFERLDLDRVINKHGVDRFLFRSGYGVFFSLSLSQVQKLNRLVQEHMQEETMQWTDIPGQPGAQQMDREQYRRLFNEGWERLTGEKINETDVGDTSPNDT